MVRWLVAFNHVLRVEQNEKHWTFDTYDHRRWNKKLSVNHTSWIKLVNVCAEEKTRAPLTRKSLKSISTTLAAFKFLSLSIADNHGNPRSRNTMRELSIGMIVAMLMWYQLDSLLVLPLIPSEWKKSEEKRQLTSVFTNKDFSHLGISRIFDLWQKWKKDSLIRLVGVCCCSFSLVYSIKICIHVKMWLDKISHACM